MKILFGFFICLSAARGLEPIKNHIPKIGIIGGGIGGTSCAFFLKSLLGNVSIDLFEGNKVGGRLSVVEFSHRKYEEGGSIIHSRNRYMVEFLELFGLKKREPSHGGFALYDGEDFVFSESTWNIVTFWHLVLRYGFGFWKLKSYIEDMLEKFERIYELQKLGMTYNTVGAMLAAMDPKFVNYLHMTTKFGFETQGVSKIVVDEIVMATIRANYGQDLNIQKMVGSVSVAGAVGNVWGIEGGNKQVPEKLLKASEANLINRVVVRVRKTPSGELEVKLKPRSDEEEEGRLYDVVIIATPQTSDQKYKIEFENFKEEIKFPGRYHKTVCSLVQGRLSDTYFPERNPIIDEILTTKTDVEFNSVGRITPVCGRDADSPDRLPVWKVFTQERMNETQISSLFPQRTNVYVREWLAYPHYDHFYRNDSFVLAPNLYHINAIEWAASAMEMSVIGAKNVALLSYKTIMGHQEEMVKPGIAKDEL